MKNDSQNLVNAPVEIPQNVREILSTDETRDRVIAIADETVLEKVADVDKFSRTILFLFLHKISLENYPYILQNELGVDEKTAFRIATYVGKVFLVPHVSNFFPKGEEYFQKWLGKAKAMGVDFSRRTKTESETTTPDATSGKSADADEPESPAADTSKNTETATDKDGNNLTPTEPAPTQEAKKPAGPAIADIKPAPAERSKKSSVPAPQTGSSPSSKKGPDKLQLEKPADLEAVSPRVLDAEPADAGKMTARLKEEIQDIANKSGASRPEIVEAWKKSRLYHVYIEMGNDSMQQGKSIPEVAAARKAGGNSYLTEPQFNAVSEISRLLLS